MSSGMKNANETAVPLDNAMERETDFPHTLSANVGIQGGVIGSAPAAHPFTVSHTPEFPGLLSSLKCSPVISTYQAGKVISGYINFPIYSVQEGLIMYAKDGLRSNLEITGAAKRKLNELCCDLVDQQVEKGRLNRLLSMKRLRHWVAKQVARRVGLRDEGLRMRWRPAALAAIIMSGMLLCFGTGAMAAAIFEYQGVLAGIDVGLLSKPGFADMNGDGDLDLFIGNDVGTIQYYVNSGSGVFSEQTGTWDPVTKAGNPFEVIDVGFYSAPAFADIDGDGDLDAIIGEYFGTGKYFVNDGSGVFTEQTGTWDPVTKAGNPFDGVDVGFNFIPAFADIDGDGDLDAFIGEYDGTIKYYVNDGSGVFTEQTGTWDPVTKAGNPFDGVTVGNAMFPAFADIDSDGDLDACLGELSGASRYFVNDGSGIFSEQTGTWDPATKTGNLFDLLFIDEQHSAPAFMDIDGDGDLDVFFGNGVGQINYFKNMNDAPVFPGTPAISGTGAVGNVLVLINSAATDTVGDVVTISYQWKADGVDIVAVSTSATFTVTTLEAHKTISCAVTANDNWSGRVSATTAGVLVANTAPVFPVTPSINGTAAVGSFLTLNNAVATDADGDTVALSYQWKTNTVNIPGATSSSFTVTTAEAHDTITCQVTANDGNGGTVSPTTAGKLVANAAPVFTITPSISGTGAVGQVLSLNNTATTDADGDTVTLSYQWKANTVNIPGATSSSFTVTTAEAHDTITCQVTANDGNGGTVSPTTAGVLVANTAPVFPVTPSISGTGGVGNVLSLNNTATTDADADTVTLIYQWKADGSNIATTATYTITITEAHKLITCEVTANDGNGGTTLASTAGVLADNAAPVFTITPSISGTGAVGQVLSLNNTATTDADGDTVTLSYQWKANAVEIALATSATYTITTGEAHKSITCVVTASDGNTGITSETTAGVAVGNTVPAFTGSPAISGTGAVGNVLSLVNTATTDADLDAVTLSYQWKADGIDISGATASTFTITTVEAHTTITCVVTANDGNGGITLSTTAGVAVLPSGDINDDGIVEVSDALKALRITAGIEAASAADLARGDVAPLINDVPQADGKIDIGDVVVILRKAIGLVGW